MDGWPGKFCHDRGEVARIVLILFACTAASRSASSGTADKIALNAKDMKGAQTYGK